jgi:hypothetical protein
MPLGSKATTRHQRKQNGMKEEMILCAPSLTPDRLRFVFESGLSHAVEDKQWSEEFAYSIHFGTMTFPRSDGYVTARSVRIVFDRRLMTYDSVLEMLWSVGLRDAPCGAGHSVFIFYCTERQRLLSEASAWRVSSKPVRLHLDVHIERFQESYFRLDLAAAEQSIIPTEPDRQFRRSQSQRSRVHVLSQPRARSRSRSPVAQIRGNSAFMATSPAFDDSTAASVWAADGDKRGGGRSVSPYKPQQSGSKALEWSKQFGERGRKRNAITASKDKGVEPQPVFGEHILDITVGITERLVNNFIECLVVCSPLARRRHLEIMALHASGSRSTCDHAMSYSDSIVASAFLRFERMRLNAAEARKVTGEPSKDDHDVSSEHAKTEDALLSIFEAFDRCIPNCRPAGDLFIVLFWLISSKSASSTDDVGGPFNRTVAGFHEFSVLVSADLKILADVQSSRSGGGATSGCDRRLQLQSIESLRNFYLPDDQEGKVTMAASTSFPQRSHLRTPATEGRFALIERLGGPLSAEKVIFNGDSRPISPYREISGAAHVEMNTKPSRPRSAQSNGDPLRRAKGPGQLVHDGMRHFLRSANWKSSLTRDKINGRENRKYDTYDEVSFQTSRVIERAIEDNDGYCDVEDPASSGDISSHRSAFPIDKQKETVFHQLAPSLSAQQRSMIVAAVISDIAHSTLNNIHTLLQQTWAGQEVSLKHLLASFGRGGIKRIGKPLVQRLLFWLKANRTTDKGFLSGDHLPVELALRKLYSYWPNLSLAIERSVDGAKPSKFITRLSWMSERFVKRIFQDPDNFEPNINTL